MKNILYPLIAAALVTIAPFLLTFENGQDIIHGLVSYGVFALLLLYVNVSTLKKPYKFIAQLLVIIALVSSAFVDLKNLVLYKDGVIGVYAVIPIVSVAVAIVMMKPVKKLSLNAIAFTMFISLLVHLLASNFLTYGQPIFEFPLIQGFARLAPYSPSRNNLPAEFRQKHEATDSVTVTKYYVDSTRSNVVVLVESWGIPMDAALFEKELAIFKETLTNHGVHFRMYSRTRTAEREDLLDSAWRTKDGRRDSLFMPRRFRAMGVQTTFLFGGDSLIQRRHKYIQNIGFDNSVFIDSVALDFDMAQRLDSILADTLQRHFIAWTTRDSRFPIDDNSAITENLYFEKLLNTLQIIADLAKKHPDVRFIVQGDHEPILAPAEFGNKFYRRWVPYVILN